MVWLNPTDASCQAWPPMVRIGFSKMVLGNVNENDALAAVKIWTKTIVEERGIPANPSSRIFQNTTEIAAALADKKVDCICITLIEYVALGGLVGGDTVLVSVQSNAITEEYLLLVHRDSGIERLGDLKGQTLNLLEHPRACLASAWLDTLVAGKNLGPAADFFRKIVPVSKIDRTVLPVFFRQAGACLVTRNGFETMMELNPQTGQHLKVLESSPPVVPVVFCFRSDYNSPVKNQLVSELSHLYLNPAGRQILTLFQSDRPEEHPVSCLDASLKLLAEHRRLFGVPLIHPTTMTSGGTVKGVE